MQLKINKKVAVGSSVSFVGFKLAVVPYNDHKRDQLQGSEWSSTVYLNIELPVILFIITFQNGAFNKVLLRWNREEIKSLKRKKNSQIKIAIKT